MAENVESAAAAAAIVTEVTGSTCGICLEESKDPLDLPCGHSFCVGCLNEWRSRYGVEEGMRRKCPICRARIPPSREMVTLLHSFRATKKVMEDQNATSTEHYQVTCKLLQVAEERIGADWDGITVLDDNIDKLTVEMPDYIAKAIGTGDIKSVLRWINANRSEDRANAVSSAEMLSLPALIIACLDIKESHYLTLITLLLQLGSDVDIRSSSGSTAISNLDSGLVSEGARLLLSWGASFFPDHGRSRESCISRATGRGLNDIASLLESEFGGRRCEIFNLTSKPELNGKTCVADEYLPTSSQYKVTLETKNKDVLVVSPDNLKRRDRTPQDCGYYIEFKNGRTVRHDFDSSEDCRAFVAALDRGEAQEVVTEEAEARAEQAAAELLSELGLDDSPKNRGNGVKKSKKKKGSKKKKK